MGNHFLCRTLSSHSPSGSSLSTYLVIRRMMERMTYTALFSIMMMMMILILWQWLPMMCQNVLTSQRPSSGVLFQCSQTPRENDQAGLITKLQCKQGPKSGRNIILHPLPPSLSFSCPVCWVWHQTKSEGLPALPPPLINFCLLSLFSLPMTPASSLASLMALTEGLSTSLGLTCTKNMLWGLTFELSEGSPLNLCLLCKRIDNTAVSHNFM